MSSGWMSEIEPDRAGPADARDPAGPPRHDRRPARRRLGVTERAARRYVAILREAGIPVESVRGPYGGYRLGRGLRLPPLVFTAAEALGLVMAVLDGRHAAADAEDPVGSGLGKIIRALPVSVGRQAATMREHARAVPDRGPAPTPHHERAGRGRGRAAPGRASATAAPPGTAHSFEVDPWAVVVRYGRWYLLCFAHHADAMRTYRIDRVPRVGAAPHLRGRPTGSTRWRCWRRTSPPAGSTPTRVVFHAPTARWRPAPPDDGPPGAAATPLRRSPAAPPTPTMYAQEWLAAIPFEITVEGGPELRSAIGELSQRMARAVAP